MWDGNAQVCRLVHAQRVQPRGARADARWDAAWWGSRVLELRRRNSGEPRRVSVNVLTFEGSRVPEGAPRGETQWVRNSRVAGQGLHSAWPGARPFWVASEIAAADKESILRAYLKRWTWEVGVFNGGGKANPSGKSFAGSPRTIRWARIEKLKAEPNS